MPAVGAIASGTDSVAFGNDAVAPLPALTKLCMTPVPQRASARPDRHAIISRKTTHGVPFVIDPPPGLTCLNCDGPCARPRSQRQRLRPLSRYNARPGLGNGRAQSNAAGKVMLRLKSFWCDGAMYR